MTGSAKNILEALLSSRPRKTADAPDNSRGIYGLIDHNGDLRYIGSTKSAEETLRKRIHQRHRTGSENSSHYFARMYNTGRMWRDRDDKSAVLDARISKELRNEFISDHCGAVWIALPDQMDISRIEQEILAIAPSEATAWNWRGADVYAEPVDLVDLTLDRLKWPTFKLDALERQHRRFANVHPNLSVTSIPKKAVLSNPLPEGDFRFFALDVETANGDRGSICQIGIACVRPDNTIETWVTYVNPQTSTWAFTYIHGISARKVAHSPTFDQIFPMLQDFLGGKVVYQHSKFDQSAISAACRTHGLESASWEWRDSVLVAREAWPELKGNGGHGLAALKSHLSLQFQHHDAGEDARASAEVVLLAERVTGRQVETGVPVRSQTCEPVSAIETTTVSIIRERVSQKSKTAGKSNSGNPICDGILFRIQQDNSIQPHGDTKYISAFNLGGVFFAIDKMSESKQPIWVVDRADLRAHLDADKVGYDIYPSDKGRNSNLWKLPNFKDGQLLRIYPETVEQAMTMIAKLGK